MNLNKAREYFSAYYEGTLDKGLSQSFERSLREDAQLQAEYRAFESTMTELSKLSQVVAEPPDDLHEMIAARLDRHIWESKQKTPGGVRHWFKFALIGGLAVGVLAIAMFNSNTPTGVKRIEAGPGITAGNPTHMDITAGPKGVVFSYQTSTSETIVISDAAGKELDRMVLSAGDKAEKPLQNPNEQTVLLSIKVGKDEPFWLVLPGTRSTSFTAGTGTLKQFVQSLAEGYKTPIVLRANDVDREVSWEMGSDLVATANKLADSLKLKAELRQVAGSADALLWIQEH